jgi:hypothetical protein
MNLHDAATASAQQCFSTSASAFSIGIFASLNDITSSQCSAHRGQSRRSPGTDSQAPVTAADAAPQHSVDRQSRFWSPGVTTFTANRLLRSVSLAACGTATSPLRFVLHYPSYHATHTVVATSEGIRVVVFASRRSQAPFVATCPLRPRRSTCRLRPRRFRHSTKGLPWLTMSWMLLFENPLTW